MRHHLMPPAVVEVRPAAAGDWAAVAELVNFYIATTTVNFRTEPQTPQVWAEDWARGRDRHPWLVAVVDGEVAGIAYAGQWKARAAYDWCAEVTGYVADGRRGQRVGHALYRALLATLDAQGYRTVIGVIGLPNEPSARFHEAFGFQHTGTLRGVGYKQGRWCDIGFWQRAAATDAPPGEIRPFAAVWPQVRAALDGS
ncbi:N-acetyltransferase [Catellatospora methionotrophica]|uniref:N-acetyltransferase n=1 Tax=Catellatospora methionotrophica TaxID=121620 RepID=A0A8J3LQT7_9ACTN|nr:GNAT family N-acetyltransferase [Catellatospora methionotrophica]GIG19135.1 N-acetyltransferase [Catellatospora methionotrophica]